MITVIGDAHDLTFKSDTDASIGNIELAYSFVSDDFSPDELGAIVVNPIGPITMSAKSSFNTAPSFTNLPKQNPDGASLEHLSIMATLVSISVDGNYLDLTALKSLNCHILEIKNDGSYTNAKGII